MGQTRYRVRLSPEAEGEPAIDGWANAWRGEGVWVFTLDHEYPDAKPEPGWRMSCRLGNFTVTAAEGRELTVQKVEE